MTRVKGGVHALKRRRKILKYAKGFKWGRKSKERLAREALLHAWSYAFRGRKEKKRDLRALWQTKIGAAAREGGMSYSRLISALKKQNIALNRKMLALLAEKHPEIFSKILIKAK
ncbi:MAG: 50S ribosomal protein L20 [Patescibacteria group bacterium]